MKKINYYYCVLCNKYLTNNELKPHLKKYGNHNVLEIFTNKKRVQLSKFLSLILRHKPQVIKIHLNKNGFTKEDLDEIIDRIINKRNFQWVGKKQIEAIVRLDPKGRFEIKNNSIRARYGHSIEQINIDLEKSDLPSILYHGTSEGAYKKIKLEGLKAMNRNLVHLTSSLGDAKIVGMRHTGNQKKNLIILQINVKRAEKIGCEIWQAGKNVFVSNYIPSKCITLHDSK